MRNFLVILVAFVFLSGCSATYHAKQVRTDKADRVTVGTVQREIRIGMPSSQVIEALGSPNVVSTDENRLEVWVYDKIATDVTYSNSNGGVWVILGIGGQAGASSTSQRTLTIVVKFDADKKVRDFAYHSSSF